MQHNAHLFNAKKMDFPTATEQNNKTFDHEKAFEAELGLYSRQSGQSEGDFTVFNPMPFVHTRVRQKWLPQSRLQK